MKLCELWDKVDNYPDEIRYRHDKRIDWIALDSFEDMDIFIKQNSNAEVKDFGINFARNALLIVL